MEDVAREADARSSRALSTLHPSSISDSSAIRMLLRELSASRTPLNRGMNRKIEPEIAYIAEVRNASILLSIDGFESDQRDTLFLNFILEDEPYFFQASVIERLSGGSMSVEIPSIVYKSERRSRERVSHGRMKVAIRPIGEESRDALLLDYSDEGIAVEVDKEIAKAMKIGSEMVVCGGPADGKHAVLRNSNSESRASARLGLETLPAPAGSLRCESFSDLRPRSFSARAGQTLKIVLGGAQVAFDRATRRFSATAKGVEPNVIEYLDCQGRPIRGILDATSGIVGSTAVVIPPAWGRTKETLMPLAATLTDCFRSAGLPICTLRFDGVNRRGESYRADGAGPGAREQREFTFSQGVSDIRAAVDFLWSRPEGAPSRTILVSFSASSIEARRAVASDSRIDGWVCVVGSADLQSMMRSISGGIDYARGLEQGASFGLQEILGVVVDMDLAGRDALENQLVYMSDAKRDMASIDVPVTWLHGRHDAWMDSARAKNALACGDTSKRKFIEIPTGHMLKNSAEALGTFQLIATEVSRMALGYEIPPVTPNLLHLERKQRAERLRLPRASRADLKRFWENYLLGRDRTIGIDLMVGTSAYRQLMACQVAALDIRPHDTVVDVGSGTGAFPRFLADLAGEAIPRVLEIDLVRAALKRCRQIIPHRNVWHTEADLSPREGITSVLPLRDESANRLLASLFLSYIQNPDALIREFFRVLKPGGRIVVSSLRKDADMSKLFVQGVEELRTQWESDWTVRAGGATLEEATRAYLNEASRLLDLEETGQFVFWDETELREMLSGAGFIEIECVEAFGEPPQAVIASASRPQK